MNEPKWECFCDKSYFGIWCVRLKTQKKFGEGFHVKTNEEAEGLCATLNKLEEGLDLKFMQGAVWAAAELIRQHDQETEALSLLAPLGKIDWSAIDSSDRVVIEEAMKG